jgi:hypothetical protein
VARWRLRIYRQDAKSRQEPPEDIFWFESKKFSETKRRNTLITTRRSEKNKKILASAGALGVLAVH